MISIDYVTRFFFRFSGSGPIDFSTVRLVRISNSARDIRFYLGDLKSPPEHDGEFGSKMLSLWVTPALGVKSFERNIFVMKGFK